MNLNKKYSKLIIILAIYILTITTAYALFAGTLNITGNISTAPYYKEPYIPLEVPPISADSNLHHSREIVNCGTCYTYGLSFYNEEFWDGNFYIRYKKDWNMLPGQRIDNFYIKIKNTTEVPFTNGKIEAASRQGDFNSLSAELSTTTINPGEECTVKINVNNNYMATTTEQEAGFYITYDVQGNTKTYNIIIGWKKWNA